MKEWYKDFIGVYENIIPKELCGEVINLMNSGVLGERGIEEGSRLEKEDYGSHLEFHNQELTNNVKDILYTQILPLYTKKYDIFSHLTPLHILFFKIQKTHPSGGYHVWHCESSTWDTRHRVGVYTIYLNNIEEGGETEFLYQSLRVKPTQGTVCIFPAGYTHTHRGNPPLSGEKYIITGWIEYLDPKLLKNY